MAGDRLAYSVSEAARLIGVSRPTVYAWLNVPGFPWLRVGGVVRIPARALEEWLNTQTGVRM